MYTFFNNLRWEAVGTLGVGIVGCGAVSSFHIDAYERIDNVKVVAVTDLSAVAAKRITDQYEVAFCKDIDELLSRDDIQIVSVCTPSGMHEEPAVKAAYAGKHVVVEKPIEISLVKIDNMIAACRDNNVLLTGIFNNRFLEGNSFVKKAIDAGRFGRMINVNAFVRWYRAPEYYGSSRWRGTWALDGGGALMNQGIHYVDLLRWFVGDYSRVNAYAGRLLHLNIEAEDTIASIIEFKSGAIGVILAGTSMYPGFPAEIQLTGTRGSAVVSDGIIKSWSFLDEDPLDMEARSFINGQADSRRASDPMAFDSVCHERQLRRFVEAVVCGGEPEISGEEARKSVELVLAVYENVKETGAGI